MRVILHIDMNSFFASVEQQKNPYLRGKPVIVGGAPGTRSIVAAASREAKKFGIKTAMPSHEAYKLCPQAIFVAPDFDAYIDVHHRFLDIFQRYTELVEVFSIDEAFLDITDYASRYAVSGDLISGARHIAQAIKVDIYKEIGEWMSCSVGIAQNKLMAKFASDLQKPDGLVVIPPGQETVFLDRAELQDICGIGPRLFDRLRTLGIHTFADLRACPVSILRREFGPVSGTWLHSASHGQDQSPVVPLHNMPEQKSFSKQHTLAKNTKDPRVIASVLWKLSEIVGRSMRQEGKQTQHVFWWFRFADFSNAGGHTRHVPGLVDSSDIYASAWASMNRHAWSKPVRLVSVGVADLVPSSAQLDLFVDVAKQRRLTKALDAINNTYGEFTIHRATTVDPTAILEAKVNAMMKRV